MVGIGLANLISIFAPEIIILGGGMSEANDNYFSMIKKSAFENSLENCRSEVLIARATPGIKSCIAWKRLLQPDPPCRKNNINALKLQFHYADTLLPLYFILILFSLL